ncbi:ParA family protein [Kaarinaea lacus]
MKIIASYNIKGGVGKTATAVNLAYLAAQQGAKTLLWDLDPQGAASFYLRIKPKIKGGTKAIVNQKKDIDDFIKGTDYINLDLLPADFSYRHMDLMLENSKKSDRRLYKILKPLKHDYDFVFLDCPPSISLVTENVLYAADVIVVPTIPTTLSLRTLKQLKKFCSNEHISQLQVLPFFSMVDARKKLHRRIVETPLKRSYTFLDTHIPYASEIEQMGTQRSAVGSYAGSSRSAAAYEKLWEEIKGRLFSN